MRRPCQRVKHCASSASSPVLCDHPGQLRTEGYASWSREIPLSSQTTKPRSRIEDGNSRDQHRALQPPCESPYPQTISSKTNLDYRQEKAREMVEQAQESNIEDILPPEEAYRLSRIRNIGIAVRIISTPMRSQEDWGGERWVVFLG